jgi:hypothetical protein
MSPGNGSETGHKHFQHPDRRASSFGPTMDRFSFIALDLSLQAVIADKSLYGKFREGGETIVFRANDFADAQNSAVFARLLALPKLKESARRFAAICQAPLAAVPTLDDFLAGRNVPGAKTPITTSPVAAPKPRPAAYIPAYPVVDALNFSAALTHVGDRVELIGRIVEVKPGSRKRGKGPPQRYVFINFGPSRGNIIRISIWSEGLGKLKERPSAAWVGRWMSVTGLMDVPYESKRYGYKHLSITVQEDGQIQQLEEAEAGFRLSSIARAPPPQAPSPSPSTPAAPSAAPPPATTTAKPKSGRSRRPKQAAPAQAASVASPAAAPPAAAPQGAARVPWRRVVRIGCWIAVIATTVILVLSIWLRTRG